VGSLPSTGGVEPCCWWALAGTGAVRPPCTLGVVGHLLDRILHLPPMLVLALVFLFPAVEASIFVGVLVPGETGIVLGGVLANQHKLP
jgi:membrane-associated protein